MFRILLILIFVYISAETADAEQSRSAGDLIQMSSLLNTLRENALADPVQTLKDLNNMDLTLIHSDKTLHLLWLIRKVEAANYSYQFEEFESNLDEAERLVDSTTGNTLRSRFLLFQSISKGRQGDYQKAISMLEQAAKIAGKIQDNTIYVMAQVELAYTLSLAEQYEPALLELQKAYLLNNQSKDLFAAALIEESYGVLYGYMDKSEDSMLHYHKAYNYYRQLGYPYYIGESAYGIASSYRYANQLSEAIEWFNTYRDAVKGLDKTYTQFFFQYGIGMTYAEQGECTLALSVFAEALTIKSFIDYKAEIWKKSAKCYANNKDYPAAQNALVQAKVMYQKMPALSGTSWELEVEKITADILAMQGEYQQALNLLDDYYQKYLLVQKQNTSEKVERVKLSMQHERSLLELRHLEKETQLQQLRLSEQLKRIEAKNMWLVVTAFFIIIILLLVWWQYTVSKKFKSLSITDELTGLSNRRFIFTTIERLLSRKQSKSINCALMLIDVDDLKPINDKFGHQDGDKVLKMVAEVGRAVLRDGDIFARIGGDEFMLFLTRTTAELSSTIATRIIQNINQTPVTMSNGEIHCVSVSIGVVSINDRNIEPELLYTRVDEALYQAKSSGRNCVKQWASEIH